MNAKILRINYVAFLTIIRREFTRIFRIWGQVFLPPAITMILYFIIFGSLIGKKIGLIQGVPYMEFLAPGLIMMSVVTNSYSGAVSGFFSVRYTGNIEEMLIAPIFKTTIVAAFVVAGAMRGLIIGAMVLLISMYFTHFTITHIFILLISAILTSILFGLAGFVNAVFARSIDDVSIVPTFVLTPLTYFAGVFYSIKMLPPFWQALSHFNPVLYIVDIFRFAALGIVGVNIEFAFFVEFALIALLLFLIIHFMRKGYGGRV